MMRIAFAGCAREGGPDRRVAGEETHGVDVVLLQWGVRGNPSCAADLDRRARSTTLQFLCVHHTADGQFSPCQTGKSAGPVDLLVEREAVIDAGGHAAEKARPRCYADPLIIFVSHVEIPMAGKRRFDATRIFMAILSPQDHPVALEKT